MRHYSFLSALYQRILRGTYRVPDFVSQRAKDVLHSLLVPDPYRRATVRQVRGLPWVVLADGEVGAITSASSAHLISENPQDDIDEGVLQQMVGLGIAKDVAKQDVLAKRLNSCTACYYLLRGKKMRGGQREDLDGGKGGGYTGDMAMDQQVQQEDNGSQQTIGWAASSSTGWASPSSPSSLASSPPLQAGEGWTDDENTHRNTDGWKSNEFLGSANSPKNAVPTSSKQRAKVERARIDRLREAVVVGERRVAGGGRVSPAGLRREHAFKGTEGLRAQLKSGWGKTNDKVGPSAGHDKATLKSQLTNGWGKPSKRTNRSDLPTNGSTSSTASSTDRQRQTGEIKAQTPHRRVWEAEGGPGSGSVQPPLFMVRSPSRPSPAPATLMLGRRRV
jgi:hypothetical protein